MRSSLLALVTAFALFVGTSPAFAAQGTTTTELPLRAAPASNTELLLTMPAGSAVTVGSCSAGWCRVTWKSYTGYTLKAGLVITTATPTRAPVRGGITTEDGSQLWPILPPYPYRAGYYPKADWYHDIPPYVAIKPSFYHRRYFMMLREHNRYRYVPHIFTGNAYGDGGPGQTVNMKEVTESLKSSEGY
jgi:SH3 domain-containing protein